MNQVEKLKCNSIYRKSTDPNEKSDEESVAYQ